VDRQRRRELGAWYTPPALVDAVADAVVDGWLPNGTDPVRVLDPACGDGRFLLAVHQRLAARGLATHLTGVDLDATAIASSTVALGGLSPRLLHGDALNGALAEVGQVDLVVGNPPFLTPLAARNTRVAASSPAGAPYADAATQFLAAAWERLDEGGRLGFVLPQSVLANRDAAVARGTLAISGALRWFWWSPQPVFEASVRTCALVAERGAAPAIVQRVVGPAFERTAASAAPGTTWSRLIADLHGVPPVGALATVGVLADRAWAGAGFRDEFYGIAAAVGDDVVEGPPLVTSGLIDPGLCHWGERSVRVARRGFQAPRVQLDRLPPPVRRWADRQLVPKVLVASQTKVLEAVADPSAAWLPGVPVVTVAPHSGSVDDVWEIAAALTNPITSAIVVSEAAGSGMSASTVRVAAKALERLPLPAGSLGAAAAALRAGDLDGCATAATAAYGIDPASDHGRALLDWWRTSVSTRRRR
jgi:SAM-dependent methyltransferase